nr:SDR family NAD(P)-dependent oxidoreductase [Gammaproteobacteria bacterium]
MTDQPHCIVIGVGAGTGAACVRRFMKAGYHVSMIARSQERLENFAAEMPGATPYAADIADQAAFRQTLERATAEHGTPHVVLYNATQATFGKYTEIDLEKFERNFRVNSAGLLLVAQLFGPAMASRGAGSLI